MTSSLARSAAAILAILTIGLSVPRTAAAGKENATIIDQWATVTAPPPPELKPVAVNPGETAFLVLDIQNNLCNAENRPRCLATVPAIEGFLGHARQSGMTVVYSLTSAAEPTDIRKEVAPLSGEPMVRSSVDKFLGTDLETILRQKNITTVILAGTAAHGAVLHTATGASARKFRVIVPVDGMSADLYAEQYTAWHLVNAPGSRNQTTLTRFDMISVEKGKKP